SHHSGMIVTISGATGFIGRALVSALAGKRHEVRVLARDPERAKRELNVAAAYRWDGAKELPPIEALAGADAVVNLAGESIAGGRWTARRKNALRTSRIDATRN